MKMPSVIVLPDTEGNGVDSEQATTAEEQLYHPSTQPSV